MILLQLLWSFTKIGFTSFGGLSMIPLISSEMQVHQWMTAEEVSDIVAIAEMTPGPLGLNCATFAGMRTAGLPGAIAANLAKGQDLETAVATAKEYLSGALAAMLDLGHGSGPLDHAYPLRTHKED